MVFTTTTTGAAAISPDAIRQLIELPVASQSVAFQVATIVDTDATHTRFPRLVNDVTASWTAEGDEITPSDPTTDDVKVTPAKVAGLSVVTNEAAADTNPAVTGLIGEGLGRDIARKVDAAFFGSSGSSDVQPDGLMDLAGVTNVSAGAAWVNFDPFVAALSNVENLGVAINAFVAHPDDVLALAVLKESSTSQRGLLTPDPKAATQRTIEGVPLLASPDVTKGIVWGIPKSRVMLVRRTGTTLDVDRSAYFTSDKTAIRATMRVGFGFVQPAAVQKISLTTGS